MTHDSPVAVNPPYSNARRKTTIRVLEDLWEAFKKDTAKKHLSTCHVLEALMTAWLYGGSMAPGLDKPISLTVNMQHVVKRPRRAKEVGPTKRKKGTNHYADGVWFYDPELEPGEIVVEQPKEWGSNRCADDFTWVESRKLWWKKD